MTARKRAAAAPIEWVSKQNDDGSFREARASFRNFTVRIYRSPSGKSWAYDYEGIVEHRQEDEATQRVKYEGSNSGLLTVESAQRCALRDVRRCRRGSRRSP